jgi:hypothetical protein
MSPGIRRGIIVRPMSPFGTYWSQAAVLSSAAYIVREDLIFSACHFDQDAHEDDYYTEHDEPTPEETRLLASLALSIGPDRGFMAQYPDFASLRLDDHRQLDHPNVIIDIEQQLREALAASNKSRPRTSAPLPPASYDHFHWPLPQAVFHEIYANIDAMDHLLIRGLATWLKSSMLYSHSSFGEEANYPLWISLDASLAIIFEALRAAGNPNPTALDAGNFIHDAFGEQRTGLKYFEEFYEDRIMTMHPQNRFGTFAFAPIGHDDFYWLHNGLRDVYRYIILGKVVDPQAEFDTDEFWADFRSRSKLAP